MDKTNDKIKGQCPKCKRVYWRMPTENPNDTFGNCGDCLFNYVEIVPIKEVHKLKIVSLHDTMLECSCGHWNLTAPGQTTKAQAIQRHTEHKTRV